MGTAMILNLLEFYEKYDYLVALTFSVIMWAFGYFSKQFTAQFKKIKISKVLQLKKDEVEILISNRHGKLILSSTTGATELTDSFVTKGEMEAALELKDHVNELGLTATILSTPTKDKTNNIFCIGGPLSNANTASYFRDKTVFFPLTFGVHKDSQYLSERNRKNLADLVHEDGYYENGNRMGSIHLLGEQILDFEREYGGYVFLAKLSGKIDFHNEEKGTVHICFGNNSVTTLSAVRCYFKYYKKLNKILKSRKHYCIIIKCDDKGNLNFNEANIKDITNAVFVQKN